MADTVTCPVCERPGVPAKSKSCPQCDADLTCFQALETLSKNTGAASADKSAQTAGKGSSGTQSGSRRAALLLVLLLVLIGAFFSLYILRAQDHTADLKQQMVALKTDLQVAEQQVKEAKQALCVLPESERIGAVEEDTFEDDDPLVYAEDLAAEASAEGEDKDSPEREKETGQEQKQERQVAESATAQSVAAKSARSENEEGAKPEMVAGGEAEKKAETPEIEKTVSKVPVVIEAEAVEAVAKKKRPVSLSPEKRWPEKTFLYLVKETDTLWEIAERFYGDGKYYPVIMEQNPGLIISDIQEEESLRLLNDRAVLNDMYSSRIEWRDGMMLWKHTVRAGETRQVIEERFASSGFSGSSGSVLYKDSPSIYPGALIRVILY
ncbi:LysM peptidoglycan-binding domain-containing protein [Candidatus Electrothrix sp.]|uniref:LysM peptidoglycan-binding domain-containing protein n=1 Tax=Candidatus Electrothrix sp. TaxID=2170559 RepID=UPI00405656A2